MQGKMIDQAKALGDTASQRRWVEFYTVQENFKT